MKEVLLSIRPEWCELIVKGRKTVEVRKTKPKLNTPFKCYIYETKAIYKNYDGMLFTGEGKVRGEFVCDCIDEIDVVDNEIMTYIRVNEKPDMFIVHETCLKVDELQQYLNNKTGYGWHISDLVLYGEPKDIGEFYKGGMLSYDDWLYGIYNGNGGARSSYESYKNAFKLAKAPQSWCYVEGVKE